MSKLETNCGEYIIMAIDKLDMSGNYLIGFSNSAWNNSFDSDQDRPFVCPYLLSNCCKCYLLTSQTKYMNDEHILRYEKRK